MATWASPGNKPHQTPIKVDNRWIYWDLSLTNCIVKSSHTFFCIPFFTLLVLVTWTSTARITLEGSSFDVNNFLLLSIPTYSYSCLFLMPILDLLRREDKKSCRFAYKNDLNPRWVRSEFQSCYILINTCICYIRQFIFKGTGNGSPLNSIFVHEIHNSNLELNSILKKLLIFFKHTRIFLRQFSFVNKTPCTLFRKKGYGGIKIWLKWN